MSRHPEQRRTTVRRRAETSPPEPAKTETAPVKPAPKASAPVAPRKAIAAPPPSLIVDKDALLAELDSLDSNDLDALLMGKTRKAVRAGEQVKGKVVRITEGTVFVDIGERAEGLMDPMELDENVRVGDTITVVVLRAGEGGVMLANRVSSNADRGLLEEAYEAGIPVDGVVESKNSGGYVVKIGKTRAFCPISQIDRIPRDPDSYIGQRLPFRISEMDERGIVVSHRAIADEAMREQAEATWEKIAVGDIVDAIIADVRPFGAFVDVNGVRGLVPRRELGWGDANDVAVGQKVSARVTHVDRSAGKLSLSMKDPSAGPWSRVGVDFVVGGVYDGTVARIRDFGAFVRLAPGLDGLVPLRHLAEAKVQSAAEAVQEGQTVRVRIMNIDSQNERLELSIRHAVGAAADTYESTATSRRSSGSASFGTFGDLLKGVQVRR